MLMPSGCIVYIDKRIQKFNDARFVFKCDSDTRYCSVKVGLKLVKLVYGSKPYEEDVVDESAV